jgi:hypothetical protein
MGDCRRMRCFGAFYVFMASAAAVGLPGNTIAAPDGVLVHVNNRASVSPQVLALAQHDVIEIYRDIGVEVVWAEATTVSPANRPLEIEIVTAAPPTVAAKVMGIAVRDSMTVGGRLAYVFYDRIRDVGQRSHFPAVTAHILGAVIAHELGHLLLPYGHSPTGLMRGDWGEQELQGTNFTWLRFTRSQGDLIRRRLGCVDRACSASSEP